jgi:hypothetical protein
MNDYFNFVKSFSISFFAFSLILIVTTVPYYHVNALAGQIIPKKILLIADENM